MIMGIGVDIVAISRIDKIYEKFGDKFLAKIYCKNEIEIAKKIRNNQAKEKFILYLAKRFCAKESFAKALGLGLGRGINFNDISIVNDSLGKCSIEVNPLKIDFIKKHFSCQNFLIHLSLSDEKNSAIAMVIIENKD